MMRVGRYMNLEKHGRLCHCMECSSSFRFPLTERFEGDVYNEAYFLNHGPYKTKETEQEYFLLEDNDGLLEHQQLDHLLCERCFLKHLLKDFTSYGHIMDIEIELFVEHMMEQEGNKQELFYSYQKKR